ncbi:MAG: type II secretion system F family protein, partial [Planctomycetota bacterium]
MNQKREQPAAPPGSKTDPIRYAINVAGVFALAIPSGFVLMVAAFILTLIAGFMGYLTSFFVLIGFVLIGSALRRLQIERKCRLLNYLKLATERNLPLPEFLDALQQGEGGGVRRRAERIADDLRMGSGLGAALIAHVPEVPLHQSAVIWRGEQTGRLREAVAHVADSQTTESRNTQSARNDIALQYALVV